MANIETPWTATLVAELEKLWLEGVTTAEIGRRLAVGKNAVVGKAARLGLPARENPVDQSRRVVTPEVREGDGCRYPLWPDGAPPDGTYCGAARIDVLDSYCAKHRRLCWVKPRTAAAAGRAA